jgi:hypothetical protein
MEQLTSFVERFAEARGGKLLSAEQSETHLYLRALLRQRSEVASGDELAAGIALRAEGPTATLCAFSLRLACANGMISTQLAPAETLQLDPWDEDRIEEALGAAAAASLGATARQAALFGQLLQPVTEVMLRRAWARLELQLRLRAAGPRSLSNARLRAEWMRAAAQEGSLFGMVNALTASARETRDPARRWQLEQAGEEFLLFCVDLLSGREPALPAEALEAECVTVI